MSYDPNFLVTYLTFNVDCHVSQLRQLNYLRVNNVCVRECKCISYVRGDDLDKFCARIFNYGGNLFKCV